VIPRAALISLPYLQTQMALHASPRGYGGRGDRWASTVVGIAEQYGCGSVLDYGCGQGSLAKALNGSSFIVREYDPAIPGKDGHPSFADLVVCTDVLEHIEPSKLDTVLRHLRVLARTAVFLVVSTRRANKTLPDGSNAHLIIENDVWWRARVEGAGFTVQAGPEIPANVKQPGKAWIAVVTP
jgi:hypothetical protein